MIEVVKDYWSIISAFGFVGIWMIVKGEQVKSLRSDIISMKAQPPITVFECNGNREECKKYNLSQFEHISERLKSIDTNQHERLSALESVQKSNHDMIIHELLSIKGSINR